MEYPDCLICPNCRQPFPADAKLKKMNGGNQRVSYWDVQQNKSVTCLLKDVPDEFYVWRKALLENRRLTNQKFVI